jgi:hypothetical protein
MILMLKMKIKEANIMIGCCQYIIDQKKELKEI